MSISDGAVRDVIRDDTHRNLFVVAGAGSGKTTALVNRISTLVLRDGVRLGNIAAVTFTEKAGAELRDRLRAEFERIPRDDPTEPAAGIALDELDTAAIGTLHSFAARLLMLHPIEAGLPPKLTPADEIGSGLTREEEWARALVALLEDEEIRPTLQRVLMATRIERLEGLHQALSSDWDLIEPKVLAHPEAELRVGDLGPLRAALHHLTEVTGHCTKDDSLSSGYCAKALELGAALDEDDDVRRYELLQEAFALPEILKEDGSYKRVGSVGNWKSLLGGIDDAKAAYDEVRTQARAAAEAATNVALENLTRWMGRQVLTDAEVRRRNGELTFQDLLVVSRQVLRDRPDVAEALSRRYTHLLLDEFQDTDPIQIELAVRIAGGAAGASEDDWRRINVPPGALFVVGDPKQSIYRFRRANIALYLEVRDWFRTAFGDESVVELTTNFRSVPSVLGWVNDTFENLIQYRPHQQPEYLPLTPHRAPTEGAGDTTVSYLGWDEHEYPHHGNAGLLRADEAADVAAIVQQAITEEWQIVDKDPITRDEVTRNIQHSDIAILVPARTSLPMLKAALEARGIAYRADASSLLYASEDVVELLLAVQAVADRSDGFALVMTLRSSLFGLGDDDLWAWRQAGGRFSLASFRDEDETLRQLPVFAAMAYLRKLSWDAQRLSPADLLEKLIRDRLVREVAAADTAPSEAADRWRRLRFLVDQARQWSQQAHGGVRSYLQWARRQASETAQVYESILPETDVEAVRIMTIHAAKGLEFPMVVLSGMTALPRGSMRGIQFLWTSDGFAVKLSSQLKTANFDIEQPIDEQMGLEEKKRLLYVGATRACDHLVVSLHRAQRTDPHTPSMLLRAAVPTSETAAIRFVAEDDAGGVGGDPGSVAPPAESRDQLRERLDKARAQGRTPASRTASGLQRDDPDVVIAVGEEEKDEPLGEHPVLAKDQRDLDTASYRKGRDASAIGTAVHGVLQAVDLLTHEGLDALVTMQCLAEGIPQHEGIVRDYALRALNSDLVRRAAESEHWRESLLGMRDEQGEIVEGFADLIFREPDGSLHVVDYKTDAVRDAQDRARLEAFYQPQLSAYARMLEAATECRVSGSLLFLSGKDPTPQGGFSCTLSPNRLGGHCGLGSIASGS